VHDIDLGIHNSKLGIKTGQLSLGMGPKFGPREMAEKSLHESRLERTQLTTDQTHLTTFFLETTLLDHFFVETTLLDNFFFKKRPLF
jgi:hypothetical protein